MCNVQLVNNILQIRIEDIVVYLLKCSKKIQFSSDRVLILLLDKYLQKRIITSPVVPELNFSNKDMYCLY